MIGGCWRDATPEEARKLDAEFQTLTSREVNAFDVLGEALVPGGRDAGFSHFIDAQISGASSSFLGILRYMDWPPPYVNFYRQGIASLSAQAMLQFGSDISALSEAQWGSLIGTITTMQPDSFADIPAALFYFVTRSDAVDVAYGTKAGFDRLGIPYLPHVMPVEDWS